MTMNGRTILITGATDGIGREAAVQLAAMGAANLVHGRDRDRGQIVVEEIKKKTGNPEIHLLIADFSSLQEVRDLAAEIRKRYQRLDVLVNNAGVFMKTRRVTQDGLEMTFGVNHVAHFLLTSLLLPLLKTSAPARIITVSSIAHMRSRMEFDNLQGERAFGGYDAYARSKLANVLFTYELARRLEGTGVTANCLHPGVIATKLLRAGFNMSGAPLAAGASTIIRLATSPDLATTTGKYFDNGREVESLRASYDTNLQRRLWEESETMCALAQGG